MDIALLSGDKLGHFCRAARSVRACLYQGSQAIFHSESGYAAQGGQTLPFRRAAARCGERGNGKERKHSLNRVNAMKPIIQVAGIKDREEAELLIKCGVTHLGFPLRIPVHHEELTDEEAAEIIAGIKPPVKAVLITYLTRAAEILELVNRLAVQVVQIHGDIDTDQLRTLRAMAPELDSFSYRSFKR